MQSWVIHTPLDIALDMVVSKVSMADKKSIRLVAKRRRPVTGGSQHKPAGLVVFEYLLCR